MADPPLGPERGTGAATKRGSRPGMPRWVKAFGVAAAVLVVLIVLMLAGVFGEGHGPGRHTGGQGDTRPAGGVGAPAGAAEAARTIAVTALDAMSFQPGTIAVSAGETVTFAATNGGTTVHEFTLGDAAMQQEHAQAMAHIPAGMAHAFPNSITLQPGETKQLTWRFGGAGTLEYACHVQGHYEAGMRGRITVT